MTRDDAIDAVQPIRDAARRALRALSGPTPDWGAATRAMGEVMDMAERWNRRAGGACEQRRTRRTCRYVRDHMGVAGNWFKRCSECGAEFDERVVDSHFVYCPECGARVIGEETGDAD